MKAVIEITEFLSAGFAVPEGIIPLQFIGKTEILEKRDQSTVGFSYVVRKQLDILGAQTGTCQHAARCGLLLDDLHAEAGLRQFIGTDQTGKTGADNTDRSLFLHDVSFRSSLLLSSNASRRLHPWRRSFSGRRLLY